MNNFKLENTVKMMLSENYKERFKAEYYQLVVRYNKLKETVRKYEAGTLKFELNNPIAVLEMQLEVMKRYIEILEMRAKAESIELNADVDVLTESVAEAVHNAWWEEKKRQGITDHPDMRPYEDLRENVKEYDRVTARAVIKELSKKRLYCN